MFLGHFGVGLAAKPAAREASLGTLFLASQFLDLLWPTFLLLGLERVEIEPGATALIPLDFTHYPWSHSLLAVVGWSVLFALVYFAVRRAVVPALVCGGLVASHWLLDLLTHQPDLPLVPGGTTLVGFGLWNHPVAAIALEVALFALGVFLYLRATRPVDRTGTVAFWFLVAFLGIIHAANLLGPPPPSVTAIAWTGQAQWLLVAWAYWIDRHREVRGV